jgi:large subunit ribosomal protein L3
MSIKLMGKKKGMTRLFDDQGNVVVCTVIHAEPNVISQIKKIESDGYNALQLAAINVQPSKIKNVSKPMKGHFAKSGINPRSKITESRLENVDEYKVGQEVSVAYFNGVEYVDVMSVSKGKSYQGVIKRHGFAGGPASHGSGFHRHAGSTGMRSSPGRNLPGGKKAGRMGGDRVTLQNIRIFKIDEAKQVIIVKGAIPGARGGLVTISKAVKASSKVKKAAPKKAKK